MKSAFAVLMLFALVGAASAIVQVRGAPQPDQQFSVEKVVVHVSPVVVSIPPLSTGYDVILNISQTQNPLAAVTTERRGQSTTGARRNHLKPSLQRDQPDLVLLA